jgi:hypothetical protein
MTSGHTASGSLLGFSTKAMVGGSRSAISAEDSFSKPGAIHLVGRVVFVASSVGGIGTTRDARGKEIHDDWQYLGPRSEEGAEILLRLEGEWQAKVESVR